MYEVTIKKSFAAAHLLKDIGGKCEELHGHNFIVEVSAAASKLNQEGLLIDFRVLKKWTDEILTELDHKHLNALPSFVNLNPSSENIARFIYDGITAKARQEKIKISCVTVWESDNARVSYNGPAQ